MLLVFELLVVGPWIPTVDDMAAYSKGAGEPATPLAERDNTSDIVKVPVDATV